VRGRIRRLARLSAALALGFGAGWLLVTAASMAEAASTGALADALPVVLSDTQFGQWMAVRLVLLLACVLLPAGRTASAAVALGAAAVAIQPMLGHAGATPGPIGTVLVGAEAVHLLAAGAWFGGLLPLWIAVRALPPAAGARCCVRFSGLGLACVALIAGSGAATAWPLVGSIPGLVGTGYGQVLLVKVGLFAMALTLAALNHSVLTPRLARERPSGRRGMMRSVGCEALVVAIVVLAAGFLASTTPAADRAISSQYGDDHEHRH
jgi:putative copper resistance protein D